MSDAAPTPPSRSLFAMSFLILMFASGLVLVYWVGAVPLSTAANQHSGPPPSNAGQGTPAEEQTREPATGTSGDSPQLLAIQQQIQALQAEMAALKTDQTTALVTERQRITEQLTKIASARQRDPGSARETAHDPGEALVQLTRDFRTLNAQFTDEGILVSLTDAELRFPKGAAALPSARPDALASIAEFLGRHRNLRLRLQGHTDSLGQDTRNLALSEQRAMAVKEALIALGVAGERIQTEGMGEAKPIAENTTEQGRAKNRRVDLYLTEP